MRAPDSASLAYTVTRSPPPPRGGTRSERIHAMSRPRITVISPVYNAAPYVATCAESCLGQTLSDLELIFVDDGSTDGSFAVLQDIAARDGRLAVIHQENAGAAAARNRALDAAHGEFVYFIDADDYIPEKTALERLYRAATEHGVAVAGGSLCNDRDGVVDYDSIHGRALDCFEREEVVAYADYQYDYNFTRFIYSLDLIQERGIRFPLLSRFEDPVFFVEVMLAAERFATIPDTVYAYRNGHQAHTWDERAVLDRLCGITQLLELSSERRLAKLHAYVLEQLDVDTTLEYLAHVESPQVMRALMQANLAVDCALLQTADASFPDAYVIEPFRILVGDFQRVDRLRRSALGRLAAKRHALGKK